MSQQLDEMLCEAVLEQLEPFIDGELEAGFADRVRAHLDTCPACAREEAAARLVLTDLRALPQIDLPPEVMNHVRTVVDGDTTRRHGFARGRRPMAWLAAAAMAVVAVGAITISSRQSNRTDADALRAAAEVQLALATIGEISQRANRLIQAKVIDHHPIPQSIRGLAHSLGPLASSTSTLGPITAPYEPTHEGSS